MSFSCNSQCYYQKDGLLIGSPTSAAFAELYIKQVKEIHVYRYIHHVCGWEWLKTQLL